MLRKAIRKRNRTARPARALDDETVASLDAWWRAANYLSAGQIYLLDNPLLRVPLTEEHIKPRLLGHWGTCPGLTFLYAHLNRAIAERDLDMIYICGPGHGGPAMVAAAWLDGTYSEIYPDVGLDENGMRQLFRRFSFPGGVPSHVAPETPGSIHEGGELGYALSHAYGAVFDNPGLIAAAVIGDGEAETGPLATAWHTNKFLDPAGDGAVLPILHLNGYKIANPSFLARIPRDELDLLLRGYGYTPYWFDGGFDDEPRAETHRRFAALLDDALDLIATVQHRARQESSPHRPHWPVIVFSTPKGWTGPSEVDEVPVENTWRSHQVPMSAVRDNAEHLRALEAWMRSYRPGELFDDAGAPRDVVTRLNPRGTRRMSANPQAHGGRVRRDLELPDIRDHAVDVPGPGAVNGQATKVLGTWLAGVIDANPRTFRLFGPDETMSNRLSAAVEAGGKTWNAAVLPTNQHLSRTGRVMEMLSEHQCQGWLEGYLLTGRHGVFNSYEAFVHIVDAMFNQHAKWLKVSRELPWRAPIPSFNYLLSSHVWRQDHNGFSHQDPGFIDHVVNKTADVIRVYLPPDANTLLAVYDQCLRSHDLVNVVVAGKDEQPQWLDIDEAMAHCARGIGIWEWASTAGGNDDPNVVMACAGDVPTIETLAAVDLIQEYLPDLKVRVVNVVDLMRLQDRREHPDGLADAEFDSLFTTDRPIVFAYHGYPWLIHRLTYRRTNHPHLHVRGYKEKGTTTTPFDMVMLNDLDRYHLVMDVIDRVPGLDRHASGIRQDMADARLRARRYTREFGTDVPAVREWSWPTARRR